MQVVIIEDEELGAEFLVQLLNKSPFEIEVLSVLDSKKEAIEWFKVNTCDLIFSDIHLGDGRSFEVFDSLKIKIPIIFTTAYDQYAIQSFDYYAVDYLLKPYNYEKLNAALEKYTTLGISVKQQTDNIEKLLTKWEERQVNRKRQERFLVGKGDQFISLNIDDIACFMADGKYLYLFNNLGECFLYDDTITNLEETLSTRKFFRVNRKYIINHAAIKSISKYSGSRVSVILNIPALSEESIIVSSKNVNAFKEWLNA